MAQLEANRRYFTPGPRLLKWITRTHVTLYRKTGGMIGSLVAQRGERGTGKLLRRMEVLLLTTTGRKSGLPRTVSLPFFQYDDRIFVIASNAGSTSDPAWCLNLRANPEVRVQLGPAELPATARVYEEGPEYERLFARHVAEWPRFRLYQAQAGRPIPMVELVPG